MCILHNGCKRREREIEMKKEGKKKVLQSLLPLHQFLRW
jgi:hypothetical protein